MLKTANRFAISTEAKAAATKCPKRLACLKGDSELCAVEKCVGGAALFVSCLTQEYCPYQQRYGYTGYLCTCPVRQEIHQKYHE